MRAVAARILRLDLLRDVVRNHSARPAPRRGPGCRSRQGHEIDQPIDRRREVGHRGRIRVGYGGERRPPSLRGPGPDHPHPKGKRADQGRDREQPPRRRKGARRRITGWGGGTMPAPPLRRTRFRCGSFPPRRDDRSPSEPWGGECPPPRPAARPSDGPPIRGLEYLPQRNIGVGRWDRGETESAERFQTRTATPRRTVPEATAATAIGPEDAEHRAMGARQPSSSSRGYARADRAPLPSRWSGPIDRRAATTGSSRRRSRCGPRSAVGSVHPQRERRNAAL